MYVFYGNTVCGGIDSMPFPFCESVSWGFHVQGSFLWNRCVARLQAELAEPQFNKLILPLHPVQENGTLRLLAPNRFVVQSLRDQLMDRISEVVRAESDEQHSVVIEVEDRVEAAPPVTAPAASTGADAPRQEPVLGSRLNPRFTFENFVEGKSNQLARAAACQVADNPGDAYNPLFIYGGTGLGKTHLMHAIAHRILEHNPGARVAYVHSERFVGDMVKALRQNTINDFKRAYRSVDALLIDDIQFFAGKERSQEEFFHTFNALLEDQNQVILTCDRYPKDVNGLEDRLKSRFNWGLTVAIEPPELETCVAILKSKAAVMDVELPDEVAFYIAKCVRSNVRELEGALRRVVANSRFMGKPITLDLAKDALRDARASRERQISIDNIKKTVAEYYKIRLGDLMSKRRTRSITRPRQMAMALAKELTSHSLPEIGDAMGGRDHTTVLHATRKIRELRETDGRIGEDYLNLLRILNG